MARSGRLFSKTHMTRRAFVAWLAVFALFTQALMPLGTALAFDNSAGGELQVICTASGVKTITVGQDREPAHPAAALSCSFCTVHTAPGITLPQEKAVVTTVVLTVYGLPRPTSLASSSIWRGAPRPSRAPPLFV